MFSTGQTVVIGVGLAMAAGLGFTTALALRGAAEPVPVARATAAGSPSAGVDDVSATTGGPSETSATEATASAPAGGSAPCRARVIVDDSWPQGFRATVSVTNTSGAAITDWAATFRVPDGVTVDNGWNAEVHQRGRLVTAAAPAWQPDLAAGETASIGFTARGVAEPAPGDVTLAGHACS